MGFTDALRQFVERALFSADISSANPIHTNKVEAVDINPVDFEDMIQAEINKSLNTSTAFKPYKEQLDSYNLGNVGSIQNFSSQQFGNVRSISSNPLQFIIQVISRQLVKVVAVIGIVLIIKEIVMWLIEEMMKPGRSMDRRFRRTAQEEVMQFWTHLEQEELRRGFKDIRVTSIVGLRGGANQVSGNMFQHQSQLGTLQATTQYRMTIRPNPVTQATKSFSTGRGGGPGPRTGYGVAGLGIP